FPLIIVGTSVLLILVVDGMLFVAPVNFWSEAAADRILFFRNFFIGRHRIRQCLRWIASTQIVRQLRQCIRFQIWRLASSSGSVSHGPTPSYVSGTNAGPITRFLGAHPLRRWRGTRNKERPRWAGQGDAIGTLAPCFATRSGSNEAGMSGVQIGPGATALTRMPSSIKASDSERVKLTIAPFVAE